MDPLLSIDFSPDDPGLEAYRKRKDAVKVTVHLDPRLTADDSIYTVLADGIVHSKPFQPNSDPFHGEQWDLFIDRVGRELWPGFNQQSRQIDSTGPLKLLGLLQDCYPGAPTPSQIREYLGKYAYGDAAIRKLYGRLRAIVGSDMILPSARGLNTDKIIIIKEKPLWEPKTILI